MLVKLFFKTYFPPSNTSHLAFAQFTALYDIISESSNDEFTSFTDPTNYPAQLLLIHFMLIEFAIGALALGDVGERFGFRRRACIAWLNHLAASLPDEYESYLDWPKEYCELLMFPPYFSGRSPPALLG